uniref:Uncharacterized protein n=1 Tax=Angiostrongylus cantonensis TaxID=6313 RepID=A0A0K0DD51_ANGCA
MYSVSRLLRREDATHSTSFMTMEKNCSSQHATREVGGIGFLFNTSFAMNLGPCPKPLFERNRNFTFEEMWTSIDFDYRGRLRTDIKL